MNIQPPATAKELQDLAEAFRNNIERVDYLNNQVWYNNWGSYLIGLRRSYQQRFLSEAFNRQTIGP